MRWAFVGCLALGLLAARGFPSSAMETPSPQEDVVLWYGQERVFASGEVWQGDLLLVGGRVFVQPGALIEGTIYVFRGNLVLAGAVTDNVVVMGGRVVLESTAQIQGRLMQLDGQVQRNPEAHVGQIVTPPGGQPPPGPSFGERLGNLVWRGLWSGLRALALGLVALWLSAWFPQPFDRVYRTMQTRPGLCLGLGVATAVFLVVLAALLAFTVLGLPLALLVVLVYYTVQFAGRMALGYALARYGVQHLLWNLPQPVWVALGTMGVMLFLDLLTVLPCIGWVLHWALLATGMGAVVLTRFGLHPGPAVSLSGTDADTEQT